MSLVNFPPSYYILRDRLPYFLLLAYLGRPYAQRASDAFAYSIIQTIAAYTLITGYLRLTGGTLDGLMGFRWTMAAPIEWGVYMVAAFIILYRRFREPTLPAVLSVSTAAAGGWFHELPWFIMEGGPLNAIRLNGGYVFFLSSQIICVPVALYLLRYRTSWTPKWYTYLGVALYLLYIPVFMTDGLRLYIQNPFWNNWLTRLPTILMLLGFTYPAGRKQS